MLSDQELDTAISSQSLTESRHAPVFDPAAVLDHIEQTDGTAARRLIASPVARQWVAPIAAAAAIVAGLTLTPTLLQSSDDPAQAPSAASSSGASEPGGQAGANAQTPEMPYPTNARGETYGPGPAQNTTPADYPDLIAIVGDSGVSGYARKADLIGSPLTSDQAVGAKPDRTINVYDKDGVTVIDQYVITGIEGAVTTCDYCNNQPRSGN